MVRIRHLRLWQILGLKQIINKQGKKPFIEGQICQVIVVMRHIMQLMESFVFLLHRLTTKYQQQSSI
jgi:hypothetical protein